MFDRASVPAPLLVMPPLPEITALTELVRAGFTVSMPSALPKASVPVEEDGWIALAEAKSTAPLVAVSVLPSLMVRSPPSMTSELMASVAAAVVAEVMRVLLPVVIAFWVNSSVGFKGRKPLPAA